MALDYAPDERAPFVSAGEALASAYALPTADLTTALRHARAFIADCQHPADPEARELLVEIDRALGVSHPKSEAA